MPPFKSKAQRAWMHANDPEMAKEFEAETPKGAKLPEKVKARGPAKKAARKTAGKKPKTG